MFMLMPWNNEISRPSEAPGAAIVISARNETGNPELLPRAVNEVSTGLSARAEIGVPALGLMGESGKRGSNRGPVPRFKGGRVIFRAAYVLARGHRPRPYEPDGREVHLFHFSGRTLRTLVASAGFEVVEVGFDRGAAAVWGKGMVNGLAYVWFRLTGLNWGMALELVARKPETPVKGTGG